MLLLADQSRAGEGLGFCISDQIQAADAATPTPRPTHPQLSASRIKGPPGFPALGWPQIPAPQP